MLNLFKEFPNMPVPQKIVFILSLIATAGIGEYIYKTKFSPTDRHHEHGYGYRFGGGVKYAWNEHWQTRAICRHIEFDHMGGYDHALEYSLGMEYHFN